jgi:sarcosine oxidase subunit beta
MADIAADRIVIVGGGIVGASIAYHVLRLGHADVLLLEAGRLGGGATRAATGGIRRQFTSRVNIELSARSIPFWADFEARTGQPLTFRQHGYVFVLSDAEDLKTFQDGVVLQRALGVNVELLDPHQVHELVPGIRTDDVVAATYTPLDGSASPMAALAGLISSARSAGLVVEEGVEFRGLETDSNGAVKGVITSDGRRDCDAVVIATGPQSRQVGALCGVDIPVSSHPRQAFLTAINGHLRNGIPLIVDMASGAYLHPLPESGRAVVGGNDMDAPPSADPTVDWERAGSLVNALSHRFPDFGEIRLDHGWSGLREMTPDGNALIGPAGDIPGLWIATGFSGHGFMQAPAAGETVAKWILRGDPAIDTAQLMPDRFRSRRDIETEYVAF